MCEPNGTSDARISARAASSSAPRPSASTLDPETVWRRALESPGTSRATGRSVDGIRPVQLQPLKRPVARSSDRLVLPELAKAHRGDFGADDGEHRGGVFAVVV